MRPGNVWTMSEKRDRVTRPDTLEGYFVFTSEFCKTSHLVFVSNGPTFWAEWAWGGSADGNQGRWVIGRRL